MHLKKKEIYFVVNYKSGTFRFEKKNFFWVKYHHLFRDLGLQFLHTNDNSCGRTQWGKKSAIIVQYWLKSKIFIFTS